MRPRNVVVSPELSGALSILTIAVSGSFVPEFVSPSLDSDSSVVLSYPISGAPVVSGYSPLLGDLILTKV